MLSATKAGYGVEDMRGYHDVGGLPLGTIDRAQHDYALWEKRVDAMLVLLISNILVGIGVWLMRDKIKAAAKSLEPAARRLAGNPLDVFGTDLPDDAFEGVTNYPHMPEGWRPKRGARD